MLIKIKQILSSQVFRWFTVGGLSVLIDTLIFTFMYKYLQSVIASNIISVTFATTFNYLMHHKVTFRSKETHKSSGFKYSITLFIFWCFNTISVKLCIMLFFSPLQSKILVALIQAPISYIILSKKVYKANNGN